MPTHVIHYYDEPDEQELSNTDYQCCATCMRETLAKTGITTTEPAGEANLPDGSIGWGECPGGAETDSDVHCSACGNLLWKGLQS